MTEKEIEKWADSRPEILKGITSGIFNDKSRKFLKRNEIISPEGKVQNICYFYNYEKKCLIHENKPEMCKKFSCKYHPSFLVQLLYQITRLQP